MRRETLLLLTLVYHEWWRISLECPFLKAVYPSHSMSTLLQVTPVFTLVHTVDGLHLNSMWGRALYRPIPMSTLTAWQCSRWSTLSDVNWVMLTISILFQLITNQQPYSYIKHTAEVIIKASKGTRPRRPTEPRIIARGLDDNLWNLMTLCWDINWSTRPTIDQALARLQ